MYLIQFPDAKGNKTIGKYKDCFQVHAIEFESGRSTVQTQIGEANRKFGKNYCSPIRIKKEICKASPLIMESCSFGKAAECKIYFLDNNNTDYVEITLRDALFSNYKFSAHGEHPNESFDISYTRIDVRHTPRNDKGMPDGSPTSSGFDLLKLKR